MKHFVLAALSVLFLTVTAGSALAQFERSDFHDTPLGSIYVSAFPDWYFPYFPSFPTFVEQKIYVVADIDFGDIGAPSQNLTNGIRAWEGGVTMPPELTILSTEVEGAINLGLGLTDFVVGIGSPILTAASTPRPLVTISVVALGSDSFTSWMGVTPVSTPSFPGVSVWIEELTINGCQNVVSALPTQCFFVWDFVGSMLISNEVAVEEESFGALKARFDR